MRQTGRFEVHEHRFITGPLANGPASHLEHSHADGDRGHKHPNTGPALFTIDAGAWLAATGLKGGGTKRYTREPVGKQLDLVELEDWQRTFRLIVTDSAEVPGKGRVGAVAAARLVLEADVTPVVDIERREREAAS